MQQTGSENYEIDQTFDNHRAFMEALSRYRVTFDHKPLRDEGFSAKVRRWQRAGIIFSQIRVDSCTSVRGKDVKSIMDDEYICLVSQFSGSQNFRQGSRDVDVREGEVFIWNAQVPGVSVCSDGAEAKTCMIPFSLIRRKIGDPGSLIGQKSSYNNPLTRILFNNIVDFHEVATRLSDHQIPVMLSSIIDMLVCSLGSDLKEFSGSRYQKEIFNRSVSYIHQNLEDCDLSIGSASERLRIGARSIQQAFMLAGLTFGGYVRQQRLKEAAEALVSPGWANVSITEIACRFGFYDLAHFSRSFKEQFHCSPKLYRKSWPLSA